MIILRSQHAQDSLWNFFLHAMVLAHAPLVG